MNILIKFLGSQFGNSLIALIAYGAIAYFCLSSMFGGQ